MVILQVEVMESELDTLEEKINKKGFQQNMKNHWKNNIYVYVYVCI